MTTRLYSHPLCLEHLTPPGHPECVDRLKAIEKFLQDDKFDALDRIEAPKCDDSVFALAHPQSHVNQVRDEVPESGMVRIDDDTVASAKSWQAVERAVGAATSSVDALFEGKADNSFCAVRPPGHHAEKTRPMGFCLVNTIAIAARYAQEKHGAERVAIVDFDVHHGNGTQDIFESDKTVMFASTHQMPLYPGSGAESETGVGNIHNVPLDPGNEGHHFKAAMRDRILPALHNFSPDLLLVSAGFDAHVRDPLANINLVEDDFDWATGKLMEMADTHCQGRLVSLLEGGYDLTGLANSVGAHVSRLMRG